MLNAKYQEKYLKLKNKFLKLQFSKLNPMQQKAVFNSEGSCLVLAGAGSGKTTVIINKIAFLIKYGDAYYNEEIPNYITEQDVDLIEEYINNPDEDLVEKISELIKYNPVSPYNIIAITFTNKAAEELKNRLYNFIGEKGNDVIASTFHSACVKILRRYIDRLGYERSFAIYDTEDSKSVMKDIIKSAEIDSQLFTPKIVLSEISKWKNQLLSHKDVEGKYEDIRLKTISELYTIYQERLKKANAVDFDDIIMLTVRLFEENDDVREFYQNKFKYVLVDEYQDTNYAQYMLCKFFADKYKNICVVGDDDQSIYKFRGATIENILNFEKNYKDTQVIRLEQNYRSTKNILSAANNVIDNNRMRKGKTLWTENELGEKITVFESLDQTEEAMYLSQVIQNMVSSGERNYKDFAVLYRTNAQSASVETAFVKSGIPYRLIGAHKFYDRKEIKDMLAYLSVINNPHDDVRLKRIINEPKRSIGKATIDLVEILANSLECSMYQVISECEEYEILQKVKTKLIDFRDMIERFSEYNRGMSLSSLFTSVYSETGYEKMLITDKDPSAKERIENIGQLHSNIVEYESSAQTPSLSEYLEEVSLFTDIDNFDAGENAVVGMTIHGAKGLEFPVVFVIGMEENLFPSSMSVLSETELEEERRLAYVAYTRAKSQLYLTRASQRLMFGKTSVNPVSRFVTEIPSDLKHECRSKRLSTSSSFGNFEIDSKINEQATKSSLSSQTTTNKTDYKVGERVSHATFGEGMIISMTPMGNDILMEIAFPVGTKKVMANFAKLKKI
ncbi:MAG: UvrD-helicase domain-containing protein [Clostridia bacterium]|nr:UvrD-helicase domain-containing protein [Clostridia bacterium]